MLLRVLIKHLSSVSFVDTTKLSQSLINSSVHMYSQMLLDAF